MISLAPPERRKITMPAKHLECSIRSVVRHSPVVTLDTPLLSLNVQPADHVRTSVLEGTAALCRTTLPGGVLAPIVAGVGQQERGGPLGFRIGLLYTRFASMRQALWAALREDGQEVIRLKDLQIRSRACGVIGVRPRCLGRSSPLRRVGVDHGPG
jgi:hypothetical protein